jgi:DNA-binding CsgD family transcriptional regulator/tetratricopeptide (TPR) repeat protein
LEFLAHQLADTHLLILGTYRDVEVRRGHPLQQTLGDLTRERLFERVTLRGFEKDEVEKYVDTASNSKASMELVDDVYDRTDGNPLFVSEVVRLLNDEGDFGSDTHSYKEDIRVPEGVREVIGRRLNKLPAECNMVLKSAAVFGRQFDLKILTTLIDDQTTEQILSLLEEALASGMLVELPASFANYQFGHALTQQTLVEELTVTQRILLHARIANMLEEMYGEQISEHAIEIVEHVEKAETVLGTGKLIRYLIQAGKQALAAYSHEEALDYFKRGLKAKGDGPIDEETAELYHNLGLAQMAFLQDEAIDSLSKAFDYYAANGLIDQAVAVAASPLLAAPGTPSDILTEMCEQSLRIVEKDSLNEAKVLAKLCFEQAMWRDRTGNIDKVLTVARREGDVALEMRTLAYMSALNVGTDLRYEEGIENAKKSIALAREVGDLRAEVIARHSLVAGIYTMGGVYELQKESISELLNAANRLRDRMYMGIAYQQAGRFAMRQGLISDARKFNELVFAHRNGSGPNLLVLFHGAVIELESGNLGECQELIQRAAIFADAGSVDSFARANYAVIVARVAISTGDLSHIETAEKYANDILDLSSVKLSILIRAEWTMESLAIHREERETAALLYASSRTRKMQISEGSQSTRIGLLARTAGEIDLAIADFKNGIESCDRSGSALYASWSRFYLAETLLQKAREGDHDEACNLLQMTIETTRERGMGLLEGQALELLKAVKGDVLEPGTPAYRDGLTKREVEIFGLISEGMTNKAIGEKLFISTKTVNTHVRNILEKVGAANRTEASVYAMKHGLVQ